MNTVQYLALDNDTLGPVRVDDWPNPLSDWKTIVIYAQNFIGSVTILASLFNQPGDDDWVEVQTEVFGDDLNKTVNRVINSRDRYIWLKVSIKSYRGRVDRILVR